MMNQIEASDHRCFAVHRIGSQREDRIQPG
jgi:hypothetical protein